MEQRLAMSIFFPDLFFRRLILSGWFCQDNYADLTFTSKQSHEWRDSLQNSCKINSFTLTMNNLEHGFFPASKSISIMNIKKQIWQEWQKQKLLGFKIETGKLSTQKHANEYTEHINTHTQKRKKATTETKIEQVNKKKKKNSIKTKQWQFQEKL